MRRNDDANRFPLGILPLGSTNSIGNTLFPGGKGVEKVKQLIEASMAIIKGNTVWKDAMKIEPILEQNETPPKPIYALSSIAWGAFRDTLAKKDKYWIYGPWREYASFIFNGYKDSLAWDCSGTIIYTPPCTGCSNCLKKKPEPSKRWSFFLANTQAAPQIEQSQIINPECSMTQELCFKTSDFRIRTPNVEKMTPVPSLHIMLGKNGYSYIDFVKDGCKLLKGDDKILDVIPARTVELYPKESEKELTIEIDQEEFDVKPVKITLLPKVVKIFCKPELSNN